MKTKTLSLLFSSLLIVIFTACGGAKKPAETKETSTTELSAAEPATDFSAGKAIYEGKGNCFTCHQLTGAGIPGTFPPLAGSDYLLADKERAIKQAVYGSKEPITVNGVTYPGKVMTTVPLSDQELTDVVNYILNSWGNNGGTVTLEEVQQVHAAK